MEPDVGDNVGDNVPGLQSGRALVKRLEEVLGPILEVRADWLYAMVAEYAEWFVRRDGDGDGDVPGSRCRLLLFESEHSKRWLDQPMTLQLPPSLATQADVGDLLCVKDEHGAVLVRRIVMADRQLIDACPTSPFSTRSALVVIPSFISRYIENPFSFFDNAGGTIHLDPWAHQSILRNAAGNRTVTLVCEARYYNCIRLISITGDSLRSIQIKTPKLPDFIRLDEQTPQHILQNQSSLLLDSS
jgi:hypothetical protein